MTVYVGSGGAGIYSIDVGSSISDVYILQPITLPPPPSSVFPSTSLFPSTTLYPKA